MNTTQPQYAGFGARLLAYFIDQSIIQTMALVVITPYLYVKWPVFSGFMDQIMALYNPASLSTMGGEFNIPEDLLVTMLMCLLIYVAAVILIGIAYGALMEASESGATYGKRYCGIRVVDLDGQRIGMTAAITRNIGVNLPAVLFNFDGLITLLVIIIYLLYGVTKRNQTVYDLAAKAIVVKK